MSDAFLDLDLLEQSLEEEGLGSRSAPRIPRRPNHDRCVLSYQQQRLWFLYEIEPASAAFNVSGAVTLRGELDRAALRWALEQIVQRHEVLRIRFIAKDGTPWQQIAEHGDMQLVQHDLSHLAGSALTEEIHAEIARETTRPFDLELGPLCRSTLLLCGERQHVLIVTVHHIVCDGWSIGIFMSELAALYRSHVQGQAAALTPLPLQYGDYAHWQREHQGKEHLEEQLRYWQQQLADLPTLWLPWNRPRSERAGSMIGGSVARVIPAAVTQALRRIAGGHEATLAMIMMAAFQVLLYRYAGQHDFGVGLAHANRTVPELEGLIGFFVNMLVIRADLHGSPGFADVITHARDTMIAALQHADAPFEMVVDRLSPERHINRHPLFQVSFVWQNLPPRDVELPGLTLERIGDDLSARFDMEIFITESDQGARVNWVYDACLFDHGTIAWMADAFGCLLEQVSADPDIDIDRIRLLPPERGLALVREREQARRVFPSDECLHRVFSRTAARFPRRTGLATGLRRWRYHEIEAAANRMAHFLIARGVTPGSFVGLYLQHGTEVVISILAVLKAGAAYVPVDPLYPPERARFILADSGVSWVIADAPSRHRLGLGEGGCRVIEITEDDCRPYPELPPEVAVTPDMVAYVIYTSGSTGQPKGCLVTHRHVVRLMRATEAWFGFGERDVWTLFHSYAFDFSVWEMWGAWFYGGQVVVIPYEISRDPEAFYDLVCTHRVTVLNQTPSAFKALIDVDREAQRDGQLSLRYVIFGGEALDLTSLAPWVERHGDTHPRLVNMYGITETTVHVTYRPITQADVIERRGSVIGQPLPDLSLHILDAHRNPVPPGAIGELYVGGAGVALGYLNRDELTRQRFIPNPVAEGERWYRSGDLGRWLSSQDIEYCGRADQQVKIRGYRVEIEELRSRLQALPAVRDSLVTLDTTSGDGRLLAYVVPDYAYLSAPEQRRSLSDQQVAGWRQTFDTTYAQDNPTGIEEFNTAGWQQSYDGSQIPDHEMRAWLDHTLDAIRAVGAPGLDRVLEIGCGTGMLLLNLAPLATTYVGVDLSAATIDQLTGIVARRGLSQVELHQGAADDLACLRGRRFDTIILNSVVQYFPSGEYLLHVLRESAARLDEGGVIFVGDVRNLALLEAYHASVIWRGSSPDTPCAVLAERVRLGMLQEEELVIDPSFFARLPEQISSIRTVVTSAKPGTYVNELTKYRYDVYLCREGVAEAMPARLARQPSPAVVQALREDLASVARIATSAPELHASPLCSKPQQPYNQPTVARAVRGLPAALRAHVGQFLPDYMIPAHITVIESFPLTVNGKVNLKALPSPSVTRPLARERFVPPRPGAETVLAEVWRDVLDVERLGRDDNFFALGGHSLMATRLMARINQRFETSLPLRAIFEHPTLAGLARLLADPDTREVNPDAVPSGAPDIIPIGQADRAAPLPLSCAQRRLWFLEQLDPGKPTYNTYQVIDVHGPLDLAVLDQALGRIIERHEILRTSIVLVDDQPRQLIDDPASGAMQWRQGSYMPNGRMSALLRQTIITDVHQPFALDRAPLMRVVVYSNGPSRHTIVLVAHHIVIDGWSLGVLVSELNAYYQALRRGDSLALPPLPMQYADYASWQQDWLQSTAAGAQRAYWLRKLAEPPVECTLPHDAPPGPHGAFTGTSSTGATLSRRLGRRLSVALADFCARQHLTPFIVLLSALYTLLYRLTGKDDLIIGSPIAQRNRREFEPLIGFFVNTLALRARPRAEQTFRAFVSAVRQTVLNAYEQQNYPFERLVEELLSQREGVQNPLFQVMLVVQNQPMEALSWDGLACTAVAIPAATAKFDLTLFASEAPDGETVITAEYCVASYREQTMHAYLDALQRLLEQVLAAPDTPLAAIALVPAAADSAAPAEPPCLLVELFARSVHGYPDAVAVEYEGQTLTYGELDSASDRIAHALVAAGVRPEQPVGVLMEPQLEVIPLFLGILKAGGVYLPLDPRHPSERLEAIVADSCPTLVVTDGPGGPTLLGGVPIWTLPELRARSRTVSSAPFTGSVHAGQLAYIMYTSGSTGQPKGAMIEHRGVANLALTEMRHYGTRHGDRVLLAANLTFDASISEIINVLGSGATLVIMPRDRMMPDASLVAELRARAITWWTIRPSFLSLLRDRDVPSLRTLIVAGEKLEAEVVRLWLQAGRRVFNAYGPTETTVCASCDLPGPKDEQPAIGEPLDNVRMYILDPWLNPLPNGITGELYIGGVGVGRGYTRQPALTAERFLPDPFAPIPGARMYRTGDLGKRLASGKFVCLGRADFQIKLRGYRIDPGEIEACLQHVQGIRDAVVTCQRQAESGDFLVAHVVTDLPADEAEQRTYAYLREHLAEYMIPRHVVTMRELPLGANGKLDRRALPAPESGRARPGLGSVEAPRTTREWQLCQIFERVLERRPVGPEQSFFELGGHSFLAVRLVSEIARELGKSLPVSSVFTSPTVRALSTVLEDPLEARSGLVAIRAPGDQEPLYLVHQAGGYISSYFPLACHIAGDRPIYGLQPPGLDGEREPLASVSELAQHHLRQLRALQPRGPYYVAGHSLGGIIAYEMAQRLRAAGQSVAYLGLIDTHLPEGASAEIEPWDAFRFIIEQMEALFRLPLDIALDPDADVPAWITKTARALSRAGIVAEAVARHYITGLYGVFVANVTAYQSYRAVPYIGTAYVYHTQTVAAQLAARPELSWERWLLGGARSFVVPGDHLDILQEPHVATLGQLMTEHIVASRTVESNRHD